MEISGRVIKIFDEVDNGEYKERIIRIESSERNQILDIYCYNKLSFRAGFLKIEEEVVFSIILRGILNGEKQDTQIVLHRPIKPNLILTKDHPIEGVEWIRKDSSQERQNKK
ncbi:hypothetical protein [Chryseobacterium sp. M5A1_1a]